MAKKKIMTTKEYSVHRGVNRQRISKLLNDGILKGAAWQEGRFWKIDREKADIILNKMTDVSRRPLSLKKNKKEPTVKEQRETVENAGLKIMPFNKAL